MIEHVETNDHHIFKNGCGMVLVRLIGFYVPMYGPIGGWF